MPIKQAACPNCGGALQVDDSKRAGICKYCSEPFVIEDAINIYNTTNNNNIKADVVNIYGGDHSDFVIRGGVLEKYNGAATEVVIPDGVTHIGGEAFVGCMGITSVTMPDSVIVIMPKAFYGCGFLSKIILSNCLITIGEEAFSSCTRLNSIVLPNTLKYIVKKAFSYCSSLCSISIPESIVEIENEAFSDCINLASLSLPDSLLEIKVDTFKNCDKLYNIQYSHIKENINCFPAYNINLRKKREEEEKEKQKVIEIEENKRRRELLKENKKLYHNSISEHKQNETIKSNELRLSRMKNNKCTYCGGSFSFFLWKCKECGRPKDY